MMRTVRKLCDELGKTVILVLHEINYAAFYSDYICAFVDGKVAKFGTVEEVMTKENLSAIYQVDFEILEIEGKPFVYILLIYAGVPGRRRDIHVKTDFFLFGFGHGRVHGRLLPKRERKLLSGSRGEHLFRCGGELFRCGGKALPPGRNPLRRRPVKPRKQSPLPA